MKAIPAHFPSVLQMTPGGLMETAAFDTVDGLYDCAWSEENENILLAASGDGSVKVYDLAAPPMANPLRVFKEHKHEVCTPGTATPSALSQQLHSALL
jgi:peroxin-7